MLAKSKKTIKIIISYNILDIWYR